MRISHKILIALLPLWSCVPMANTTSSAQPSTTKKLIYEDWRYESNVRSDILYPNRGFVQDVVQSSTIALNTRSGLILEFDVLNTDYEDYNAKLIHCNHDWTKSSLPDLEFTIDYNEYPVRNFEYSQGPGVPYTHYVLEVPGVKISGNYLLVIYRGNDPRDLMLSRRFMVFDSRVQISPTINVMTGATGRFENHQIEFDINYSGLQVMNPFNDLKVVIRQNQRWDNAITSLRPTQVRQDKSVLRYRHFTGENTFVSLNEFRFIDLRSSSFRGQNVARIEKTNDNITADAVIDKPRSNPYSQYRDLNGSYFIENNDPGANFLEEGYIETTFYLDLPQIADRIFMIGAFNNWQRQEENQLKYDSELNLYQTTIPLKQGFYNYLYYVENGDPNPYYLEGAYFEAENDYEILVYFREPGRFADQLIGYRAFGSQN